MLEGKVLNHRKEAAGQSWNQSQKTFTVRIKTDDGAVEEIDLEGPDTLRIVRGDRVRITNGASPVSYSGQLENLTTRKSWGVVIASADRATVAGMTEADYRDELRARADQARARDREATQEALRHAPMALAMFCVVWGLLFLGLWQWWHIEDIVSAVLSGIITLWLASRFLR